MLFDEQKLREHFDNDVDLISELLQIFESSYPDTVSAIENAISEKNYKDLELHAHTLKGMVSNFFAEELRQAAFALEKIGTDESSDDTTSFVSVLKEKLPLLVTEIRSIK